jgi:hypothetical protein
MSLEAKRFRHVAIAIPVFAIAGIVTVSPRQKSTESQQPDVAHSATVVGRRCRSARQSLADLGQELVSVTRLGQWRSGCGKAQGKVDYRFFMDNVNYP